MGAVIRRRYAGARARLSAGAWLASNHLRGAPPLRIAGLGAARAPDGGADRDAAPRPRLVVIAPHPDDEVLACGGLAALVCAAGWPMLVIAVTDGEASHGRQTRARRDHLARRRHAERSAGLRALGAGAARLYRLRLPDGGVAGREARLMRRLCGLMRRGDTVVVTSGLDGHPDHEAAARAALDASARVGARLLQAPVWLWQWCDPAQPLPWSTLRRCALTPAAWWRKQHALRCHRSQQRPAFATRRSVLDAAIRARARWPDEYFFDATDDPRHAR